MSVIALFDRLLGHKARSHAGEPAAALPAIHIVSLAPSGATDALAKALEQAHFTDGKSSVSAAAPHQR